jgi:flagellar hook-length control protein FliK
MPFSPALAPLPAPVALPPAGPQPSAGAGEATPGGFARLLEQARDEAPAGDEPTAAGDAPPTREPAADKAARGRVAKTPTAAREAGQGGSATAKGQAASGTDTTVADPTDLAQDPASDANGPHAPGTEAIPATLPMVTLAAWPGAGRGQAAAAEAGDIEAEVALDGDAPTTRRAGRTASLGPASGRAGIGDARTEQRDPADATRLAAATRAAAAGSGADALRQAAGDGRQAEAGTQGRSFAAELHGALTPSPMPAATAGVHGATPAPTATASAEATLQARPGSAAFAPELGAVLSTFVRDGVQHARLELNPAQLGPVTVQIQLDGQAAQVHLAAAQPETRSALEQAMPALAGSLREAGLTLAGGGVFDQPRQPGQPGGDGPADGRRAGDGGAADGTARDTLAAAPAVPRRRGVVDLVA